MSDKTNKSKIIIISLIVLIIILTFVRITYIFAFEKDSFHSDEIWSFGLANSNYEPYIYADDDKAILKNFNEWSTGETYRDYLTVQEDERFNYSSIIYNQDKDVHPPLYYMILHTICSFFPNTYSLWYGYIINAVSFVVLMVFAYRLAKLMTNSKFFALSFIAYLGLCDGIVNLFTFVRMYTMSTAIFMAFLFYMLRLMKTKNIAKNVPWLVFLVFLGAYTHHFYLVAVGIFTALVSLYFLFSKIFLEVLFVHFFDY